MTSSRKDARNQSKKCLGSRHQPKSRQRDIPKLKASRVRKRIGSQNTLNGSKTEKKNSRKLAELKKLSKALATSKCWRVDTQNGNNNSRVRKSRKSAATAGRGATRKVCRDKPADQSSSSKFSVKKRCRRSKSKTRFTHVKQSKSKLRQEASTSAALLQKLKYDTVEYSSSTLKALETPKNLCHVEVCAYPNSSAKVREIKNRLKVLLKRRQCQEVVVAYDRDSYLREHVQAVNVIPAKSEEKKTSHTGSICYQIHVYQMNDAAYITGDWEEEDTVTAKHWVLPNMEFEGVWESLIFDSPIKEDVLNYAMTMLMYSDKNIDRNIICCNRVVLLHGPPGTGKTSLCRAMAQKLCIRLSYKYRQGQLVEINSQGLFSKYYSESGKLVGKMFDKIQEFINKKDSLVCILIDEVESLANNRKNMMNGNEPSDSMRVVNALLTRLDEVKRYPNVIVFTTTNVTKAIEAAFLDRADIKKYIGPPNAEAIYSVYRGCLHESMRAGIITPELTLLPWKQLDGRKGQSSNDPVIKNSLKLKQLSMSSVGLSGRSLRKLPMLFHAEYLPAQRMELNSAYWEAMYHCIQSQFRDRKNLNKDPEI